MKRIFAIFCLIFTLGFGAGDFGGSIGAGVSYHNGIYDTKSKSKVSFLPSLSVNYGNFYLNTFELGYQIWSENLGLSIYADFINGFAIDKDDLKDGYKNLKKRKSQIAAGVRATYINENFKSDIFLEGGKRGYSGGIALGYDVEISDRFSLTPSLNYTFYSKKFTDYYFGVKQEELGGKIDRRYSPKQSHSYGVSLDAEYSVTDAFSLFASALMERYSKEITSSPIVKRKFDTTLQIGIRYSF